MENKTDIEQLKHIWRACFNDTDSYIDLFLDNIYTEENTMVYSIDGKAVAAYYFMEAQTVINGKRFKTLYLYAAGTLPEHRKNGYMSKLIEDGVEVASNRGYDFIALVPAEDYLFDYYGKFEFERVFKKKKIVLNRKIMSALAKKAESCENADIYEIRQKSLEPYDFLSWGKDIVDYAMKEHEFTNGFKVAAENGYALYTTGKDTVYIKELCTAGSFGEIAYLLLDASDFDNFVFNLPVKFPLTADNFEIVDVGMLKPLNKKAENAMNKINNAYIGLTLG